MSYPVAAVERATTIHQAILHALHGRQTWLQVADVLGLSPGPYGAGGGSLSAME